MVIHPRGSGDLRSAVRRGQETRAEPRESAPVTTASAGPAMTLIYLDNNATTPVDPRVLDRLTPFLAATFGNPSSRDHADGWDAAEAVEEARLHVMDVVTAIRNIRGEMRIAPGVTLAVTVKSGGEHTAALRETTRLVEFLNDTPFDKFVEPIVVPLNSYE